MLAALLFGKEQTQNIFAETFFMRTILLLMMIFPVVAKAQLLSGVLTDDKGSPLPNATLVISKVADSTVIKYSVTNKSGAFALTGLPFSRIILHASFTGYKNLDTLLNFTSNLSLQLQMIAADKTLGGITITAAKPLFEVRPDKIVLNVQQSAIASAGNAFELLKKLPNVLVDPNDAISMNGKTGVRIYIDGRPSPLSVQEITALLRTMPATDVEAIEIITNPSARYEAAGNAGIINIRLIKNKSIGSNGTVNAGWLEGIFPKYNASLSLNQRTKKANLFGTYSHNEGTNESYMNLLRYQNDSVFNQRSTTVYTATANNVKLGADWAINKLNTIGLLLNGNFSTSLSNTTSTTPIAAQSNREVVQTLNAFTTGNRRRKNGSANINWRFADTTGHIATVDADYSFFDLKGNSYSDNNYSNKQNNPLQQTIFSNSTPVAIHFYSVQASWQQNLWKGTLEAGLRSAFATTQNRFSFYNYYNGTPLIDAMRSNYFSYTENIQAAYAQYNKSISKWSYQAGVRLEQTSSLGELTAINTAADKTVKRSYLNAFPSLALTYNIHPKHQLGLSYSRRIDRPSYQDLNPFENRIDELTYQKGNPFLRPQFTDNIELRHTFNYVLTTSFTYSNVHDFFAAITDTVEGRRNFITQQNIAQQKVYSLNSSKPFTVTKWWTGYGSAGATYNKYRADFGAGKIINIDKITVNLYTQNSFIINKKLSAELSAFYVSPYVWAGNYECRSSWSIDAGAQYKLLADKATIKLSVTDIFQRMPWSGTSRLGSLYVVASGGWESRLLRLNFSYRFGNKEVKAARQRTTGIDDLNKRVQ